MSFREWIWLQADCKCHWCGRPTFLTKAQFADQATEDHIIPRYKGGIDHESNIASACSECNMRRNIEDQRGLPEGALLGVFRSSLKMSATNARERKVTTMSLRITQTKHQVHVEQRDQALKEIKRLQTMLSEAVWNYTEAKKELREMTYWKMTKKKFGALAQRQSTPLITVRRWFDSIMPHQ